MRKEASWRVPQRHTPHPSASRQESADVFLLLFCLQAHAYSWYKQCKSYSLDILLNNYRSHSINTLGQQSRISQPSPNRKQLPSFRIALSPTSSQLAFPSSTQRLLCQYPSSWSGGIILLKPLPWTTSMHSSLSLAARSNTMPISLKRIGKYGSPKSVPFS